MLMMIANRNVSCNTVVNKFRGFQCSQLWVLFDN